MEKTLNNTSAADAVKNDSDIIFFGDGDKWKLIGKASSKEKGWMKSTKAMEILGVGCLVQVSTQQFNEVAEAITFVPGVKVVDLLDETGKVIDRSIVLGIPV